MPDWRRVVVFTHRWLGIAGSLLFIAWFASGIVMMYARMPELSSTERAARRPPLDLSTARVSFQDAFAGAPALSVIRLGMLGGRPVYRGSSGGASITVFADTGERLGALTPAVAVDEARRFASRPDLAIHYEGLCRSPTNGRSSTPGHCRCFAWRMPPGPAVQLRTLRITERHAKHRQ